MQCPRHTPHLRHGSWLLGALAALVFPHAQALAQAVPQDGFFAYEVNSPSVPAGYNASPWLDNSASSAASVAATLSALQASGAPLAVRVRQPLTNPAALAIFNQFTIKYVFGDFAGPGSTAVTRSLADAVLGSTQSQGAFVGNFNFYPNASIDSTQPSSFAGSLSPRFQSRAVDENYLGARGQAGASLGNQIAMPSLLPGAPDYRSPASGNSVAPNIRAALFTLPIQRLTYAGLGVRGINSIPTGAAAHSVPGTALQHARLIPVVSRFNNYGNPALDSDGDPSNGYHFIQNAANPANGQLLSRGDFSAQILHYRMRGADSVNLFGGASVIGYSQAQARADVAAGWSASPVANAIFARGGYAFANLSNSIGDSGGESGDTAPRDTELSGAVWSGVYDIAGPERHLAIVLSNLAATAVEVDFPLIAGFSIAINPGSLDTDNFLVQAGLHQLLEFTLSDASGTPRWTLDGVTAVFTDSNRNGVGVGDLNVTPIPEASTVTLGVVGALSLLVVRRLRSSRGTGGA